ncbi:hypothetical protein M885DRAFT_513206 [Pelagophyceae sp. CCMP2097]|nr:hypothetical protein M885DRAFT_513206 [Pelagophyceae sp. CCMP2097]|mmetsp:Transcript_9114/g.30125  ORF Transcript_9114/g.30125 Transcript_9114/m.30125 type:complete len:139 (+) Transcript_9114:132-548(+)
MALVTEVTAISSAADWQSMVKDNDKILVIDVHQKWCGPCDTVKPAYALLNSSVDDCKGNVSFLTASVQQFKTEICALGRWQVALGDSFDLSAHGCMPIFLVVQGNTIRDTVVGADVPKLKACVEKHVAARKKLANDKA